MPRRMRLKRILLGRVPFTPPASFVSARKHRLFIRSIRLRELDLAPFSRDPRQGSDQAVLTELGSFNPSLDPTSSADVISPPEPEAEDMPRGVGRHRCSKARESSAKRPANWVFFY